MSGLRADLQPKIAANISVVSSCWEWQRARDKRGYGYVCYDGRSRLAHRASYLAFKGEIPDGLVLDHLCRNPPCVNPEHLEAVTQKVNMERGETANRTHCPKGHPYEGANIKLRSGRVGKNCRSCDRISKRKDGNIKRFAKNGWRMSPLHCEEVFM